MARKRAEHGTDSRYTAGCRCDRCRRAHTDRARERRRRGGTRPRVLAPPERRTVNGRFITKEGYVRIGKELEHRIVMARAIGRPLRRGETVHHKNSIRTDNRLSNLELRVSSHPTGSSVADLLAWAREILAEYEPLERVAV